jgi:hypothetical protein
MKHVFIYEDRYVKSALEIFGSEQDADDRANAIEWALMRENSFDRYVSVGMVDGCHLRVIPIGGGAFDTVYVFFYLDEQADQIHLVDIVCGERAEESQGRYVATQGYTQAPS